MKSSYRFLAAIAALALFGAGCTSTASVKTTAEIPQPHDQPAAQVPAEPTPDDSEDINVMIKAAKQEDQDEMFKEKKDNDAQVQEAQKSAIETKESEGVSF